MAGPKNENTEFVSEEELEKRVAESHYRDWKLRNDEQYGNRRLGFLAAVAVATILLTAFAALLVVVWPAALAAVTGFALFSAVSAVFGGGVLGTMAVVAIATVLTSVVVGGLMQKIGNFFGYRREESKGMDDSIGNQEMDNSVGDQENDNQASEASRSFADSVRNSFNSAIEAVGQRIDNTVTLMRNAATNFSGTKEDEFDPDRDAGTGIGYEKRRRMEDKPGSSSPDVTFTEPAETAPVNFESPLKDKTPERTAGQPSDNRDDSTPGPK